MKRTILLIIFAVLVFAAFVIAGLPASWAMPDSRTGVACGDVAGTIWNGVCSGLTFQQQPLGELSWEVRATRLLALKLNADVTLARPAGSAHGYVEIGFDKKVTVRDLQVDLPIDQNLVTALPPNLRGLRGKVHAQLALVRLDGNVLNTVEGTIEVQDLTDGAGSAAQRWGSYSLTFPSAPSGNPVGQLRDLGSGPLAVEGSLKLTPEPGFDLEGLVAARPSASADLVEQLKFLGSPDAQGRRPFSLAGTF